MNWQIIWQYMFSGVRILSLIAAIVGLFWFLLFVAALIKNGLSYLFRKVARQKSSNNILEGELPYRFESPEKE